MNEQEIRAAVVAALTEVAPEVEDEAIAPGTPFDEQFEIDSMDFLNYLTAIKERLGVDVPESDYERVRTLDDATAYLGERLG